MKLIGLLACVLGAGDVWPTLPGVDGGLAPTPRVTVPGTAVPRGGVSPRANVWAHEDLEPDALRALATAPGVTLWLSTRTNAIRESTLDTLAKTPQAFVQARPPFTAALREHLKRVGHVGLHVELDALRTGGLDVVLGNRPLAVTIRGAFDSSAVELLRKVRPQVVLWRPALAPDLLALSQARQAPGSVWLYWPDNEAAAIGCAVDLGVTVVMMLTSGASVDGRCAKHRQFTMLTRASEDELRRLALTIPSAEVSFEVADDVAGAYAVKKLLVAVGARK